MQEVKQYELDEMEQLYPFLTKDAISYSYTEDYDILITYSDGFVTYYDPMFKTFEFGLRKSGCDMTDIEWSKEFSRRLYKFMIRAGLTQVELAETADMTQASLSRYMTGRAKPSIDTIRKLVKVLGCTINQLIGF